MMAILAHQGLSRSRVLWQGSVGKISEKSDIYLRGMKFTWSTMAPIPAIKTTKSIGRYPKLEPAPRSTLQLPLAMNRSFKNG